MTATPPKKAGRPRIYATSSERQKAYKDRLTKGISGIAAMTDDPAQGASRVCLYMPLKTVNALRRLASFFKTSKAQMVTEMIDDAELTTTEKMNETQRAEYFDETRKKKK